MSAGTEATLTIEKLGHQGDGLAPWKETSQRHIRASVPFTLPGEVVRAALQETREHAHGTLLHIITPSPARRTPPCPHFGTCGGCRLQHAPPDMVAALKTDQVMRALQQNGIAAPAPDGVFTTPLHSRRRISLQARRSKGAVLLGFQRRESHDLVPLSACPVLRVELEKLLAPLALALKDCGDFPDAEVQMSILGGQVDVALTGLAPAAKTEALLAAFAVQNGVSRLCGRAREKDLYDLVLNAAPLRARFGAYEVTLPPAPFLQASDEAEAAMLDFLRPHMKGVTHFADLFCGSGLFALSFHTPGARVLAVDGDAAAIAALTEAHPKPAGLQGLRRNLMREPITARELKDCAAILLDPPRAGAREQCLEVAKTEAEKILYISCNPQSFARDARILHDGGYTLQRLKVFDQFLYSHHTEVIGIFGRG